ncbi:MAG TPA: rod shape-determining protein MreC [Deltaproteobacteria bacterium]|nr:rod shape-determining protein MreC [Deltaproteobacteria bacterium]HPR55151.1 rod shape-determining protein MreC [Deltaproteobacteria bacterium]HXK47268.1 rod shape-determining protein MreC [Deltaproteobacteria bacterium]
MERGGTNKIILVVIASAIVIVLLSLGQYRSLSSGLNPVREGFYIAERVVTAPFRFAATLWTDYLALVNVRRENKELVRELQRLRFQHMAMQGLEGENERLRAMLDFKSEHGDYQLLPATLLAQDISVIFRTVIIDRGTTHGFAVNMPVVSPLGLVGRVMAVSPHTAQVLLITDPNSAVPAVIEETQVKGIVKGTGTNVLSLEYVRSTELVEVGNMVVSSGLEGRFPKGLRIGRISEVGKDPRKIFVRIMISPSVEMSKLEGIFGVGFRAEDSQ